MMQDGNSEARVESTINAIATMVALIVGLGVPCGYFAALYKIEQSALATLAISKARNFSEQHVSQRPGVWQYESHMLNNAARNDPGQSPDTYRYIIRDAEGQLLATSNRYLPDWPLLSETALIHEAERVAGSFRVERSMRGVVLLGMLCALASAALAALIYLALRALPLRVIRQSREQLTHMAHHDALTGLPNRTLFNDRLEQAILQCRRYRRRVTLIYLDLDNFKQINDSLGHAVGDELLRLQAARMLECVRDADTVARMGGDEFVIVLFDQADNPHSALHRIQRLQASLSAPLEIMGHTLRVTPSIGAATYPGDGHNASDLLHNADAAMYAAKAEGRNNFRFYSNDLDGNTRDQLAVQASLHKAISDNQLLLHYQPQMDVANGQITGVEALIRWQHPDWGMVSPDRFIPVAEASGMILDIGNWVLRAACTQARAWQHMGLPPIVMSVNVSALQFRGKALASDVADALQVSGLSPALLELELTESMVMNDVDQAIATMKQLQGMGVRLSIDDFGTGYSSLSALKKFPVCRLKVDRSFVRDIETDDDDKTITRAVIALAHSLNLEVVAEGVETQGQLDYLRQLNCDEIQGYLLGKPMVATEIPAFLARPRAVEAANDSTVTPLRAVALR